MVERRGGAPLRLGGSEWPGGDSRRRPRRRGLAAEVRLNGTPVERFRLNDVRHRYRIRLPAAAQAAGENRLRVLLRPGSLSHTGRGRPERRRRRLLQPRRRARLGPRDRGPAVAGRAPALRRGPGGRGAPGPHGRAGRDPVRGAAARGGRAPLHSRARSGGPGRRGLGAVPGPGPGRGRPRGGGVGRSARPPDAHPSRGGRGGSGEGRGDQPRDPGHRRTRVRHRPIRLGHVGRAAPPRARPRPTPSSPRR